jgi:hypothetical protein
VRADASYPHELGSNLEHVIQLLQDASAPAVVFFQQAAGLRARNFRAAEQGQQFVRAIAGWLNGRSCGHGSLWSPVASMTTDVVRRGLTPISLIFC